jgi:hypothetical protein
VSNGAMFLIERPQPNQRRLFVVDCAHAHTEVVMDNYPRPDPARGNQVFGRLIDQHRQAALDDPDVEECACRVPRLS